MAVNYRKTLISCYLGFITQAIAANFAPLLFLTFHNGYGIPLGKSPLSRRYFCYSAYHRCAVRTFRRQNRLSEMRYRFAGIFGTRTYRTCLLPELLPDPFTGIIVSTIIYAMGSGLTEVLVSPIVEACPFEHKEAAMSLLHSFYCWGSVGVILISTLFLLFSA